MTSSSSLHGYQDAVDYFNNIPDSILPEIFKTLPVKSLLTCMCVQKSWYNFIRTPFFIKIHLNYNPKPNSLLFESIFTFELLLRYDNQHCREFHKLKLPACIPLSTKWYATSYGLICFSFIFNNWHIANYTVNTYLFNPLIRKYKTLPDLPTLSSSISASNKGSVFLAFGYVPRINDYRVVKIVNHYDANKIPFFTSFVYSLSTNSWTTKTVLDDIFTSICDFSESVFVNGLAYWRTQTKKNNAETLLCFDAVNYILRNIPLPKVECCRFSLQQLGQSVAYFAEDPDFTDINMWILRGDPMKDFFWEEDIRTEVFGIRSNGKLYKLNGELSELDEGDLVSYTCKDNEVKDSVGLCNCRPLIGMDRKDMHDNLFEQSLFIVRPFVEGLVLLDAD
ncbi:F-box domain-containing protein [Heracleum sosnowskyi]|uniref:F-box domain-containing protein n=1 Tax=Heracleum sosnowskyi TaxID=360622 RepID=A0AAD8JCV7_9APIA|nr:F-box domain-containing protein [Heracleum sosnowskyi]